MSVRRRAPPNVVNAATTPSLHVDVKLSKHWPANHVERRPIATLVPYARNARTHSDAQVAQLAASIREWGWTMPVLIDEEDGLIAGHGRVLAARLLGLEEVPVMVARGWSEAKRRAYVLADNKLALNAGWDDQMLATELSDLAADDFDMNLIGFSVSEIAALSEDHRPGLTDVDEVPASPEEPVSQLGDFWILGDHRLLCGDATRAADVGRLMGGELANMAFADPPYNVSYGNSAKDKMRGTDRPILNDALGDAFGAFIRDACVNILRSTNGGIYVCMSSSELDVLQRAFREAGGRWSTFIIWAKNTFTIGRADYQRQYEPILYGWREGIQSRYWCGARDQGDVWSFNKPTRNDIHPTMKPVGLVERALRNSSEINGIVLDPFGGSGSTLIAAHALGRRARIMELDPKYVDVIILRWQAFTGQEAMLANGGGSFTEVAAGRVAPGDRVPERSMTTRTTRDTAPEPTPPASPKGRK
jgi:DNA modification methylase